MGKVRLGTDEIKYMTLFESLTGASVKDCIQENETMGFLIKKGDMGLAIGKGGSRIEKVRKVFGKSVCVFESADDAKAFITNLFQPVKIRNVRLTEGDNGKIAVVEVRRNDRKKIIGHAGQRIKMAKKLANRHFAIDNINIKVV